MKCTTYYELCAKEINIDKWREHIISEKPLQLEGKKYCELCNMKYDPSLHATCTYNGRVDIGVGHSDGPYHRRNHKRLEFILVKLFICLFYN